MRITIVLVLLAASSCRPYVDPLCRPCEAGGCPGGLRCAPTANGDSVCVPEQGTVAACNLPGPSDAGVSDGSQDAASDAGLTPDAGPTPDAGLQRPCPAPEASGLTWVYSPYADLCFTKTEVTAEEFGACIDSACTDAANYQLNLDPDHYCYIGSAAYAEFPANCIDAPVGAEEFCNFVGGRLPTEDEWYAEASAGGTRTYPWGEEPASCEYAVMNEGTGWGCNVGNGEGQIPCQHPAGNSASGLCDMAGNLWELTSTFQGPDRIMRGGEYRSRGRGVDSRASSPVEAGVQGHIGFRCVTDPLP